MLGAVASDLGWFLSDNAASTWRRYRPDAVALKAPRWFRFFMLAGSLVRLRCLRAGGPSREARGSYLLPLISLDACTYFPLHALILLDKP